MREEQHRHVAQRRGELPRLHSRSISQAEQSRTLSRAGLAISTIRSIIGRMHLTDEVHDGLAGIHEHVTDQASSIKMFFPVRCSLSS